MEKKTIRFEIVVEVDKTDCFDIEAITDDLAPIFDPLGKILSSQYVEIN